jgi:putative aminopeptidase FrvX
MGFDATQAEIREAFLEYASEHLSDDQLAAVAGGLSDGQIAGLAGAGVAIAAVVGIAAAAAA